MAPVTVTGIEELQGMIGKTIGPSDWREVTQEMIDTFADLSGDHQWIHVDVERAKTESPFGTTIAHGNLTLAAIDGFRDSLLVSGGFKLGVNYGWNKVRFPAPVPVGSRVRAGVELLELTHGKAGAQATSRVTIELEGSDKPACVVETLSVMVP